MSLGRGAAEQSIARLRRAAAPLNRSYTVVSALALAVEAAEALHAPSPTVTPGLTAAVRPFERAALSVTEGASPCMPAFVTTKASTRPTSTTSSKGKTAGSHRSSASILASLTTRSKAATHVLRRDRRAEQSDRA